MPIVKRTFSVTGNAGTVIYREGTAVPDELGKKYPHFMAGWKKEAVKHDPTLPARLTKKDIEKMDEATLLRWVSQFHPGSAPEKADKAALVELVNELNGR